MLPRTARRLETTLLLSRQALPRPARLYSTPTKRQNAPAAATAHTPLPAADFPPYWNTSQPPPTPFNVSSNPSSQLLNDFLGGKAQLTLIPPPLPLKSVTEGAGWYADAKSIDMTGIMDACLNDQYDVPRAQAIFARLRKQKSAVLDIGIYNAFLDAYAKMAAKETEHEKSVEWIREAWKLYDALEAGEAGMSPNAKTYSLVISLWHSYKDQNIDQVEDRSLGILLTKIVDRNVSIAQVICDESIASDKIFAIAQDVSLEAANLGKHSIVQELAQLDEVETKEDAFFHVPQVRPVVTNPTAEEIKGGATPTVPFNLDSLRRHLSWVTQARKMLRTDLEARQRNLEASVYELAEEQLEHKRKVFEEKGLDQNSLPKDSDLQNWMWTWHQQNIIRVRQEIAKIQKMEESKAGHPIAPYLSLVKPEKMSLLTILELMRSQGAGGVAGGMKMARCLISVGRAVENEYKAQVCKQHNIRVPQYKHTSEAMFSKLGYKYLRERRVAAAQMVGGEAWTATWSQAVRSKVGAVLVECLMDVAKVERTMLDPETNQRISEFQPAFYSGYEYVRGQKLGVLKLNPLVSERLAKDSVSRTIHPRHLPMLIKPKPWMNYNEGGYIYNKSTAMRFKESIEQEVYLREATNTGKMELVYAGLDILGTTPWRINEAIFDVVVDVWNDGHRMGKIPPAGFDIPEPVLPKGMEKDLQARSLHIQKHRAWTQHKANNHSERCSMNYKIEIARAFIADTFYLPHNLDFRGRAYPIPPHLNHIGDDLSRSLMIFNEAKPLGSRGLRWLKIHLANLYGYDKASFEDRVKWVEENIKSVIDSAENPLKGTQWWLKADDPWQCLATCMELRNALASSDPLEYMSALPVHQDGTCNGLQHYAALGGDDQGARQVNLAAADRPSDVYTHISLVVEKIIEEDLKKESGQALEMAKLLTGKITRKVVKQTVMTTVYGVTFVGARDQIEKQLRAKGDIPPELCWAASSYLAKRVMTCIGDTFRGAKHIQTWLNLCARLISKSIPEERLRLVRTESGELKVMISSQQVKKEQMTSVIWTTALGLPIVQPYRKVARKQINTNLQSVYISDPNSPSEVNSLKQATAFPPNFIHSLDATHMMLTALACRDRGLTFASVHDSYWTHACDIDSMSAIIRDTFISLHSSNILGKLEQEFKERYKAYRIPLSMIGSKNSNLCKALANAGSRVRAHPSQAESLKAISTLLEFTEEQTDIAEQLHEESQGSEVLELMTEEEEEGHEAVLAAAATKASKKEQEERLLAGKFVRLVDLFPPLPKKGTFKVEDIKGSQYFFS